MTNTPELTKEQRAFKATVDWLIDHKTTVDKPSWAPERRYAGQNASVALLARTVFGGDILIANACSADRPDAKTPYYINVIDGEEAHFCPETLPVNAVLENPGRNPPRLDSSPAAVNAANELVKKYNAATGSALGKIELFVVPAPAAKAPANDGPR